MSLGRWHRAKLRPPFEALESRRLMAGTDVALADAATTLTPVADAYVRDGASAALNFGTSPALVVKGSPTSGNTRRTYLKFELGSLADIEDVKLRLLGSASAATPS